MKTIYNTYVELESQEQCDRMKQVCIDNGLKIFRIGFNFCDDFKYFRFYINDFYVSEYTYRYTQVTESEFLELLKNEQT